MPERPLSPSDLAHRLASYETLVDISHMLLVSVTPDDLFQRISSELNRLVPVDALTIYRVDEVNREIVPVHARDQWADEIMAAPLRLGEGLTGWVVEHQEAANVTAAERDPRIAVVPGTPSDEPEAILCVPLVVRGLLIGALNTYRLGGGGLQRRGVRALCGGSPIWQRLALDNTQNRIRLLHEAQTDWLTGLHNHRVYHERLRDELERAERYGRPVSLIVFDIDDFKLLNDVHGHQEGDLVLRRVAAAAREELRGSDLACRVGGQEFAIILPEAGKRAARAAADRLCARVRALPGVRTVTVCAALPRSRPTRAAPPTSSRAPTPRSMPRRRGGSDRAASYTSAVLARRTRQAARAAGVESIAQLRLLDGAGGEAEPPERRRPHRRHRRRRPRRTGGLRPRRRAAARRRGRRSGAGRGAQRQFAAAAHAAATAAATGRTVNAGRYPRWGTRARTKSVLAVPLAYDGQTIGVLELSRRGANRFSDLSVRLAELLAAHAATALMNARLLAAQRRAHGGRRGAPRHRHRRIAGDVVGGRRAADRRGRLRADRGCGRLNRDRDRRRPPPARARGARPGGRQVGGPGSGARLRPAQHGRRRPAQRRPPRSQRRGRPPALAGRDRAHPRRAAHGRLRPHPADDPLRPSRPSPARAASPSSTPSSWRGCAALTMPPRCAAAPEPGLSRSWPRDRGRARTS